MNGMSHYESHYMTPPRDDRPYQTYTSYGGSSHSRWSDYSGSEWRSGQNQSWYDNSELSIDDRMREMLAEFRE